MLLLLVPWDQIMDQFPQGARMQSRRRRGQVMDGNDNDDETACWRAIIN